MPLICLYQIRLAIKPLPEKNGSLKQPPQEDLNENLKGGSDLMSIMRATNYLSGIASFTSLKQETLDSIKAQYKLQKGH